MKIKEPCIITPRLQAGVQIGEAFISIDYDGMSPEGRDVYVYAIDFPDGSSYENNDVSSGCCGGSLQDGLAALLSFLGAAVESREFRERTGQNGENEGLFPEHVVDWASGHADDIACISCVLEEAPCLIAE